VLSLFAVDIWKELDGGGEAGTWFERDRKTAMPPSKMMEIFQQRISPYEDRVKILRGESHHMAELIDDGVLDFVFLDADHRYEAITRDIDAWVHKLKKGGLICGHDINMFSVTQAVIERFNYYTETGIDSVWWSKKEFYSPIYRP